MGKLLGRDKRATNEESSRDLNDFLHGPSDKLGVSHPGPPVLAKLDISSATRYPTAAALNSSQRSLPLRPSSRSPRPGNKKGLVVRFVDTFPEIIGEGGDECEIAVIEIGKMRRTRVAREAPKPALVTEPATKSHIPYQAQGGGSMQLPPVQRIQASYTPAAAASEPIVPAGETKVIHRDTSGRAESCRGARFCRGAQVGQCLIPTRLGREAALARCCPSDAGLAIISSTRSGKFARLPDQAARSLGTEPGLCPFYSLQSQSVILFASSSSRCRSGQCVQLAAKSVSEPAGCRCCGRR
jgi:hypothetical protein